MTVRGLAALPTDVAAGLDSGKAIPSLAVAVQQCVLNSFGGGASRVEIETNLNELSATIRDNGRGIEAGELNAAAQRQISLSGEQGTVVQPSERLALTSIGQLCVLEIVSKARGSFETHSKLLRGGKCLRCGLASYQQERQGTTVILRCRPTLISLLAYAASIVSACYSSDHALA